MAVRVPEPEGSRMTTLTEILRELLGQHASLRRLAAEVHELAAGPPSPETCRRLPELLRLLSDEVAVHVVREEELLGDVLPTIDAWGPVRAAKMSAEHREEHRRLGEAVRAAAEHEEFGAAIGAALPAIELLFDHMRAEEAEHLNSDVLRDDVIAIDQFDG